MGHGNCRHFSVTHNLQHENFSPPASVPRLVSVDVLRGLVMVLMALDHARDFLCYPRFPPEDMAHTNGALFFTRFVTHFCAPVFAFLAGTGAFLATRRGKSLTYVSRFFFTRGLWLLLLELTVIDFAWGFVPWVHGGVIWSLGWSMVAMALIVRLPVRWVGALGLGMIATHNLLDRVNPASFGKLRWLWMFLHTPGRIPVTAHFQFSMVYEISQPASGLDLAQLSVIGTKIVGDRNGQPTTSGLSLLSI